MSDQNTVSPQAAEKPQPSDPTPPESVSPSGAVTPDAPAPAPGPNTGAAAPEPKPDAPAPASTPDTAATAEPKPDVQTAAPTPGTAAAEPDATPDPCEGVTPHVALVVDDEPANRDFLVRLLEQAQLKVIGASTGDEALQIAARTPCLHLLVIDNRLPDMDGVELLAQLRQRYPRAKVVMATMLDERSLMAKAFENGCDIFLVKPHGFMELFRRLHSGKEYEEATRLVIDQYGPRPYRG